MRTFKNILSVAISNTINFGTSFLIGFILPMVLSVADYANYREYILYMSISYLFNFGYNDGIYIKYGGKSKEELNREQVRQEHLFIVIFQVIVLIVMMGFSIWRQNPILIIFSAASFLNCLTMYHQNFLQAIGEFRRFSQTNILKSAFNIVLLLLAIFVWKNDSYLTYIIIHALSFVFILCLYEFSFVKEFGILGRPEAKEKLSLFHVGIFILIANMSLTFVANVGSWVANWNYPKVEFAQYSFQNSVLNVILLIVNAVGVVFYNVISTKNDQKMLNLIKDTTIYLGIFSGLGFFVFKVIIAYFLPQYINAVPILSITFIAIPYIMLSKILIANLYKTSASEHIYLRDSVILTALSLAFVYGTNQVFGSLMAIAFATTICYIAWYIYATQCQFKHLRSSLPEILLLISHFIFFFIFSNYLSVYLGFFAYIIYLAIIIVMRRHHISAIIQHIL